MPKRKPPIARPAPRRPQVIEQTGKRYKAMQGCGVLALGVGLLCLAAVCGGSSNASGAAIALLAGGLVATLTGRVLAWWHHG